MIKTAAVIVNHNDTENVIKLVTVIKDHTNLDAVIIVDNGSEETQEIESLAAASPKITLIKTGKNGGYGCGNNTGIRWAEENGFTYALICNPDTEYTQECVQAMIDALGNGAAVAAPVCRTPESSYEAPKSGWSLKTWGQELLDKGPLCRRVFRKYINRAEGSAAVDAVLGACLMVDIDKFMEVGGYDEDVFLYCEENILGHKLKKAGYKTVLLTDCEYLHRHKPGKPVRKSIDLLTDSELIYFEKYLQVSRLQLLISRLFLSIVKLEVILAGG